MALVHVQYRECMKALQRTLLQHILLRSSMSDPPILKLTDSWLRENLMSLGEQPEPVTYLSIWPLYRKPLYKGHSLA